ncbi:hypothetical protein [Roseisolibacter sp. H3M3-2]|uniref:hypothetical protein n=1 Tax=Roseisolibacter sp. H3M3-2 TaxID=3031323 RepID=UPI0023DC0B84|nr:hypothetical protein [Roseisolibacter sp. H3M3-2]MDF1505222.1 hypothetical protein [Roseisolibacter sp. H3M3-2]
MPTLHLHLRDGFVGERVVVRVGDRVLLDEEGVRTRPQLGLALARELEVPAGPLALQVAVPDRGVARALTVEPARTPWVGVSVDAGGALSVVATAEGFGYV